MAGKTAVLVLLLGLSSCARMAPPFDEAAWRDQVTAAHPSTLYAPHYRDGQYFNPWLPMETDGFGRLIRWWLSAKQTYTAEEEAYRPLVVPDAAARVAALDNQDFILWIGHATFLIRLNGMYWLTDPIFSQRAVIPKRKTPPGLTLEQLAQIAPELRILISHNHHDHLDENTIRALPHTARVFVPLGLKPLIQRLGIAHVEEMDWWQTRNVGSNIRLVCLPAQHWSRRLGQGFNATLWASFLLQTDQVTVYFGGDTGYFIGHKEIGRRYPGIDYALLPTTAVHPRWFMHYAHMDIRETLDAFADLGARWMIPQQWGTFQLGDEPVGYPIVALKRQIAKQQLDPERFLILDIGELVVLHHLGSR